MTGGEVQADRVVFVTNVINRFIEYLSQEDADNAVKVLNGRELCGSVVEVTPYV
jgi:hypothetical protein